MLEREVEAYLKKRVAEHEGEVRKVQWLGRHGAPDRIVYLPGYLPFWVELKSPGKKPEPHQEREHKRMREYGERVVVIDSFEGVDALFK